MGVVRPCYRLHMLAVPRLGWQRLEAGEGADLRRRISGFSDQLRGSLEVALAPMSHLQGVGDAVCCPLSVAVLVDRQDHLGHQEDRLGCPAVVVSQEEGVKEMVELPSNTGRESGVNQERVLLWVQALRSGDFAQGEGYLALGDTQRGWRYCCLGVACEVAIASGLELGVKVTRSVGGDIVIKVYGPHGDTQDLPNEVREWLGILSPNPVIAETDGDGTVDAFEANDDLNWDFNKIADAIEATYLKGDGHG